MGIWETRFSGQRRQKWSEVDQNKIQMAHLAKMAQDKWPKVVQNLVSNITHKISLLFLEHPVYVQCKLYIDGCNEKRDKLLKYRVKLCFLKQLYKSVCVLFFQDCRDGMQTENVLDFFSLSNICTLNWMCTWARKLKQTNKQFEKSVQI